jgi:hypothetical protein
MIASFLAFQDTTMTWNSSPADVSKEPQHQFEYLFSLSKEEEYVQLVKQAGDVPVGGSLLLCLQVTYFGYCRRILMP